MCLAQFGAQSLERGDFLSVAAQLGGRELRMEATIIVTHRIEACIEFWIAHDSSATA
jgi:hypothetical protein